MFASEVKLLLVGDGLFFTLGKMTPRFLTVDGFIGVPACIFILFGFTNGDEVVVVVDVVDIVGTDTVGEVYVGGTADSVYVGCCDSSDIIL